MTQFHISVANTAPYRPDWKGELERHFRLLNESVIHWQPGAVREREPGRPDYRLDASLTLHGFRRLLIDYIIEHNTIHEVRHQHIDLGIVEDEIHPYPCNLWKWGIENCSGILREESRENIRLALMPREKAWVTRDGIHFGHLHYTCKLAEQEDWFGAVRRGKRSWSVPILHDPRTRDHISLVLNEGKEIEPCTLLEKERRFRKWDWFDVEEYFVVSSNQRKTNRSYEMQQRASHLARRDAITEEEVRKTEASRDATLKKTERVRNISVNKEEEMRQEHQQHAWQPENAQAPSPPKSKPTGTKGSGSAEQFDILRAAKEELYGRQ
jgi:hypothetical protein